MNKFAFYKHKRDIFKIGYNEKAIIMLKVVDAIGFDNKPSDLSDRVFGQIMEYLQGERKTFNFPYKLIGTDFQIRVWKALCDIPYGKTATYKEIANAVKSSNASRAVGGACNKNPILIAVPCHRVIGISGDLVGYAGGLHLKSRLINLEKRVTIDFKKL